MYFVFDCITTFPGIKIDNEQNTQDQDGEKDRLNNPTGQYPAMYRNMLAWVGVWMENNGAPRMKLSWSGEQEKEGFEQLFEGLNRYKDFGLIHFGARSTHLPMFTYKAMQYGLIMPNRLSTHDITYRYSRHNIDLRDLMSNYGADVPPEFSELPKLLPLPDDLNVALKEICNIETPYKTESTSDSDSDDDIPTQSETETLCYKRVLCIYLTWLHLKHAQGDIESHHFENLRNRGQKKLYDLID